MIQGFPKVERVADHFDQVADRLLQCHDLVIPKIIDGRGNEGTRGRVFQIPLKIEGGGLGGFGVLPQKFLKNYPLKGALLSKI